MINQQVKVTFQPTGRAVSVLPGTKAVEAAGRAGLAVESPCGGAGTCGKCRVQLISGACEPNPAERKAFSESELAAGWRLACQTKICSASVVHVPDESLLAAEHQIFAQRQVGTVGEVAPAVRKVRVELSGFAPADAEAALARIAVKTGLGGPGLLRRIDLVRMQTLLSESQGGLFTAVVAGGDLIGLEHGDTTAECCGAAFDIGTTTLVGSLLDLRDGREVALTSSLNPQVRFGDDVLSRIGYAGGSAEHLRQLQREVCGAVERMLGELVREAGVSRGGVYEIAFAGNTTMQQLLCGIDVESLGHTPFEPAHVDAMSMPSRALGVTIQESAAAYVFPVIGGFVGGDTVAGMLATRLTQRESPVLLIDIGTNGEIVLWDGRQLWAASTAAGPAFEGARISCGMRASAGAIEKIVFDDDVRIGVIGGNEPVGLCGSALIDLAAELLRCGVLNPTGRLLGGEDLPSSLAAKIRDRLRTGADGQMEFVLVGAAGGGGAITLTQRDLRELQLATGAIRAGIRILLQQAGQSEADLKHVLVAGGFGSFIRRSNAQRIGLLPQHVEHDRIVYVGNASLDGAKVALLSARARQTAETLARQTKYVQLSESPSFQDEFADAMIFPE